MDRGLISGGGGGGAYNRDFTVVPTSRLLQLLVLDKKSSAETRIFLPVDLTINIYGVCSRETG